MNRLIHIAFLTFTSLFVACSSGDEVTSDLPTADPVILDPSQVNGPSAVAPTGAVATGNLNPPHGEPGHRCDIGVGEPLDGAPAPVAPDGSTPSQSQVINVGSGGSTAGTTTTLKLGSGATNPPHGEPGHDCAVPVGDPLP